jgi:hypothetical protein
LSRQVAVEGHRLPEKEDAVVRLLIPAPKTLYSMDLKS